MVSPIKSAIGASESAFSSFTAPLTKAVTRAFTMPGTGQAPSGIPDPQLPAPATLPSAKPAKKGMQQSFLSGVAASGLASQSGSGTGKTLLGS